jgi:iron-sulfur cluster assembly protein
MLQDDNKGHLDLTLTEQAIQQVKKILLRDKLGESGLRISVSDGGCSGYSYQLRFDRQQSSEDTVLEFEDVKVFVDAASAPFLKGTVIDFVSGLYGGGFKFSNPNATGTCGCGTSFSA